MTRPVLVRFEVWSAGQWVARSDEFACRSFWRRLTYSDGLVTIIPPRTDEVTYVTPPREADSG